MSKAQDISAVQYLIKALNDSDGDITIIAVGLDQSGGGYEGGSWHY